MPTSRGWTTENLVSVRWSRRWTPAPGGLPRRRRRSSLRSWKRNLLQPFLGRWWTPGSPTSRAGCRRRRIPTPFAGSLFAKNSWRSARQRR